MSRDNRTIRVKLLYRLPSEHLRKQLPDSSPTWGQCEFLFDRDEREYDWLVVYDDLPSTANERRTVSEERLACPREHTMLVTTEPSSIKTYGTRYVSQFGCVLTAQEAWALSHPDRIYSQTANHWYYGAGENSVISLEELMQADIPEKTGTISMIWSSKREYYTMHNKRNFFMQKIKEALPDLDIYGKDIRPIDDKAEAIDNYKYHIAIENHWGLNHWTEKLADCFLGYSLPLYYGCPNLTEYFPERSFLRLDINDFDQSLQIIRDAIQNNEYEKRLDAILTARKLVIEEYNFFAVVSREIEKRHNTNRRHAKEEHLLSRHALRKRHKREKIRQVYEKTRNTLIHLFKSD